MRCPIDPSHILNEDDGVYTCSSCTDWTLSSVDEYEGSISGMFVVRRGTTFNICDVSWEVDDDNRRIPGTLESTLVDSGTREGLQDCPLPSAPGKRPPKRAVR